MKTLGIYIHIPFCIQKCLYCDFLSFPEGESQQALYFDALKNEIIQYAPECGEYEVVSVFIGGGTPTAVKPLFIEEMMGIIRDNYHVSEEAEITMECNPGTVEADDFMIYKKAGINRLSIGLQSPNDDELKRLGRIHDKKQFEECYRAAVSAGFENINVDLMGALPGQSLDDYENNLHYVCDLLPPPKHISAYSLIIEEGTAFYSIYGDDLEESKKDEDSLDNNKREYEFLRRQYPLPDEDTERCMYHRTEEILLERGYHRYEISNYSQKGYECLHNIRYWRCEDYLGLGLGAASLMNKTRFSNTRNFIKYKEIYGESKNLKSQSVSNPGNFEGSSYDEYEKLSDRAQMEEFMFMGLRMICGVSKAEFKNRFNCEIADIYGNVIAGLKEDELMDQDDERVFLTSRGLDLGNYCMAQFLI